MSTAEERFAVPERMTEAGLVFFFTSEQARTFVVEFIGTAQANDFLMFASLRSMLREDNGAKFIEFMAEVAARRADFEEESLRLGITPEELDYALEDSDRTAMLMLRGRRDSKAVFIDYGQFLVQTVFARVYASFQIYLVELLGLIFQVAPPSPAELGPRTLEEHVDYISRRKEQLYKDMYRKKLNLPLFHNDAERNAEVLIAETRHIIEHNRGRISAQFVRNVQNFTKYTRADIGKVLTLDLQQVVEDLTFLHSKVRDIDARAIAHFGLNTITIPQSEAIETTAAVPALAAGADQAQSGDESDAPTPTERIED